MTAARTPMLAITDMSKTFPGQRALDEVDFELARGEIHALIGQNGSGKSTFIKVLAGYHQPDPGYTCAIDGQEFELGDSRTAASEGLRFVHQDLGLVPNLGALDNLALGRGYHRNRTKAIAWKREARAARELLHGLGYDFDLNRPVGDLQASERTGLAIARVLDDFQGPARILVLDEPTASLPAAEAEKMFEVIRKVNEAGVSIIYVSHRFGEVFDICDRVTVLRDGRNVATKSTAELNESQLIHLTVGKELDHLRQAQAITHSTETAIGLELEGVSGKIVDGLDLRVRRGEIVGIAGVTGSGREELAGLIFGASERTGTITVDSNELPARNPSASIESKLALVPADRLTKAAFVDKTLRENLTISNLAPYFGPWWSRSKLERSHTSRWLTTFEVKPNDPEASMATLSGGNQQKVMVARALSLEPRLLILDEPTQGVDVGAKASIHAIVRRAAQDGTATVVLSTESEELLALCDRIIVLVAGTVTGEYASSDLTAAQLTELTVARNTRIGAIT